MITLIGAVVGLLSSALPDLLGLFRQRQDNAQELAVLELQMKREGLQHSYKLEEIAAEADIREIEALHTEFAQRKATWKWVEALIQSVRPVITYSFFGVYSAVKYAQLMLALRATDDVLSSIAAVWHEPDQALFATIIAFWFGHRAMRHFRGRG